MGYTNFVKLDSIDLETPKENPSALAGATGDTWKPLVSVATLYLKRVESATTLCMAIADCHPADACEIMAAALVDLSIGMPIAPLFSVMDEANHWADLATTAEKKAYALACFTRLSQADQDAFLRYVRGAQ